MQRGPLGPPNRDALADAVEGFEGYAARGALGLGHEALAERVINVGAKAPLAVATQLEQPPSRARALFLESLPQSPMAMPQPSHLRARVDATIGIGGDVDDAQVHAEHVGDLGFGLLDDVDRGVQEPLAVAIDQIALALLTVASNARCRALHTNAISWRPPMVQIETDPRAVAQDPLVVGQAAERGEPTLSGVVELVGVGHLGDHPHHDLGAQPGACAGLRVDESVELELTERALAPGDGADRVGRGVGDFECVAQRSSLRIGRLKLERHSQFHQALKYRTFVP